MNLLERYIAVNFLKTLGLVCAIVMSLHFMLAFIGELKEVGTGDYHFYHAIFFVLAYLPYHFYHFFPVLCLLSGLFSLGYLANHRELVIMRVSGFSMWKIGLALLKIAAAVILCITLFGESVAPYFRHVAEIQKAIAKSGGSVIQTVQGIWLHQPQQFIHIEKVLPGDHLAGVTIYNMNPEGQLIETLFAKRAERENKKQWKLLDVVQTKLFSERTLVFKFKDLLWPIALKGEWLSITTIPAQDMNLSQLHNYVKQMKALGQLVRSYELTYYQRLIQPLITLALVWLVLPFIFGPLRSSTMGARLTVGVILGFCFYVLNQFFAAAGIVLQLPLWMTAFLPLIFFIGLGCLLFKLKS